MESVLASILSGLTFAVGSMRDHGSSQSYLNLITIYPKAKQQQKTLRQGKLVATVSSSSTALEEGIMREFSARGTSIDVYYLPVKFGVRLKFLEKV